MNKSFNLEYQYSQYLKLARLSESTMSPIQKQETKRAFYGACGQMLVLLRDDLTKLDEKEAFKALDNMYFEVLRYWKEQTK